jgi:hypothetical protein
MKWIAMGKDSPERRIQLKLRGAKRMQRTIDTDLPEKKLRLRIPYLGASSWAIGLPPLRIGEGHGTLPPSHSSQSVQSGSLNGNWQQIGNYDGPLRAMAVRD